jgi:hypothetical protein
MPAGKSLRGPSSLSIKQIDTNCCSSLGLA